MTKDKYLDHINELSRFLRCIMDVHNNIEFLEDLKMLRLHYRKLKKEMSDKEIYPQAPPDRFSEREKDILKHTNIIVSICRDRNISYVFYNIDSFEFKKLEMCVRFVRENTVLNVLLDFE